MLNLVKLFSEAEKTNKVQNFGHFEKDMFFSKNDTFAVFRIFDRKQAFAKAKKEIFVISSSRSIK
jgi:hypothetical protein